jgi:hypothetical protein
VVEARLIVGGKGSGNPGQPKAWRVGRKRGYWRGTIGPDARAALTRLAQDETEGALIARLILAERDRQRRGPCPNCASFEHFDGRECNGCGWMVAHETDGLSDDEYDDWREGDAA